MDAAESRAGRRTVRVMEGLRFVPLLFAVACAPVSSVTDLPDPPAPLERPAEYAFGSSTRAEDANAERDASAIVARAVSGSKGKPRVRYWTAPEDFDLAGLRSTYDAQARAGGWTAVERFGEQLGPGRAGFAYVAGDRAFALIWLTRTEQLAGRVPVTVLRYGG